MRSRALPLMLFDEGLMTRAGRVLLCAMPVLFVIGRSPADIALSLVALLLLVRSWLERDWHWLRTPWVCVGLAIWLYLIVVVSPQAGEVEASLSRALPFGRFILFGAALQHWLLPDPRTRSALLRVLAVVVAFVVLDSLIQFALGRDLFGRPYAELRLSGPFDNNVAGIFLANVSFPLIGLAFGRAAAIGRPWALPIAVALALILGFTIALTGERTALAMFGFGLLLLFLLLPVARKALFVTGAACAVAVMLALIVSPGLQKRLVGHTTYDLTNFWERRVGELYLRGFKVWQEAPVFGVGLKNFRDYCVNQHFEPTGPVEDRCYTHPHHIYNEWLAEAGLIGLAGFLALIVLWARELIPSLSSGESDYALKLGACIAIAIFLWPVRPSMSFFSNWNAILFWLMLGLALALCAPRTGHARLSPPS